jgi:hypothetical protein
MTSFEDFCVAIEDQEVITQIDGLDVYWYVEDVEQVSDEEVHVILESLQCLDPATSESPVGCNACDLGDHTLPHHHLCPVLRMSTMVLKFVGDFS